MGLRACGLFAPQARLADLNRSFRRTASNVLALRLNQTSQRWPPARGCRQVVYLVTSSSRCTRPWSTSDNTAVPQYFRDGCDGKDRVGRHVTTCDRSATPYPRARSNFPSRATAIEMPAFGRSRLCRAKASTRRAKLSSDARPVKLTALAAIDASKRQGHDLDGNR